MVALYAGSHIQSFLINRHRDKMTTGHGESVLHQWVARLFDPYAAPWVKESSGRDIQSLLGPADYHDLS
jgi:hypothetical protein